MMMLPTCLLHRKCVVNIGKSIAFDLAHKELASYKYKRHWHKDSSCVIIFAQPSLKLLYT